RTGLSAEDPGAVERISGAVHQRGESHGNRCDAVAADADDGEEDPGGESGWVAGYLLLVYARRETGQQQPAAAGGGGTDIFVADAFGGALQRDGAGHRGA